MIDEISLKLFTSAFMNFQFSNSIDGNFDRKPVDRLSTTTTKFVLSSINF